MSYHLPFNKQISPQNILVFVIFVFGISTRMHSSSLVWNIHIVYKERTCVYETNRSINSSLSWYIYNINMSTKKNELICLRYSHFCDNTRCGMILQLKNKKSPLYNYFFLLRRSNAIVTLTFWHFQLTNLIA